MDLYLSIIYLIKIDMHVYLVNNICSEEVQNVIKIQRKRIREKIPFPKNDFSSITRIDFMISILYSAY